MAATLRSLALRDLMSSLPSLNYRDEDLRLLQEELSRITLEDLVKGLRGERVLACHSIRQMTTEQMARGVASRGMPFNPSPSNAESAVRSLAVVLIGNRPRGWRDADAAILADFVQNEIRPRIDVTNGLILRDGAEALAMTSVQMAKSAGWLSLHRTNLVGTYGGMLRIQAQSQAQVNEALLWCAMERFRLKHGQAAAAPEDVVPEFLAKLPCDPVNGMPLRFVRKGERDYLLYSIGWNGKDDGGVETKRRETGDWVWASDPRLIVNLDEEKRKAEEAKQAEWEAKRGKPKWSSKAKRAAGGN